VAQGPYRELVVAISQELLFCIRRSFESAASVQTRHVFLEHFLKMRWTKLVLAVEAHEANEANEANRKIAVDYSSVLLLVHSSSASRHSAGTISKPRNVVPGNGIDLVFETERGLRTGCSFCDAT
jgi:hypothetical protein